MELFTQKLTKVLVVFSLITHSSYQICYAQLKVKDGGKVLIGYNNPESSDRLTIDAGQTNDRSLTLRVRQLSSWGQSSLAKVSLPHTVSWVVRYNNSDRFYVAGEGWLFARNAYFASDSTIKKDIAVIENPISKITALRGVTFSYKPEMLDSFCDGGNTGSYYQDSTTHMGLIAQEVESILPEAVREMPKGDGNTIKAVSYTSLIGLLIEGIKAQQEQIEDLQTSHNQLIVDNVILANELQTLQSTIDQCCNPSIIQGVKENGKNTPKGNLKQNVPNPFNEKTVISYQVPAESNDAFIVILNLQGTLIKSFKGLKNGNGEITLDAGQLAPGMYIYSLYVNNIEVDSKRMILVK